MAKNFELIKDEIKETELQIQEVETGSIIVKIDGWRMRVYFEENTAVVKPNAGQVVKVKYQGDINDVHTLKLEKIK